jgi:[protein-PII] uridylyltransferase
MVFSSESNPPEETPENLSYFPQRLKEFRHAFGQLCRNELPGICEAQGYALDLLHGIREEFFRLPLSREGWAAVAVGGLGRGELSFLSNLDLLFLYKRRLPEDVKQAIRRLTGSLSDAGFDARYVMASPSSVSDSTRTNFSFLTTYLETQFMGGDQVFYQRWQNAFMQSFGVKRRQRFLKDLIAHRQSRLQHHGESSYLLEPNLKETAGGLRDLHVIRWAARIFFHDPQFETAVKHDVLTSEEQGWLEKAHDFLWRVRLQLHQLTGSRQDKLSFPQQQQIAKLFGFPDSVDVLAVEAFMRLYYRHTARICRTTGFFLERLHDKQIKVTKS